MTAIASYIREVADFPKKGIVYKDLTPLLAEPKAMQQTYEALASATANLDYDLVVGTESRGFIFGVGLSMITGKGFIPIRKKGKLPGPTHSQSYQLEYGTDCLEIHQDAIKPCQKVLMVDDLLATGGTMQASIKLAEQCGAEVVGCAFVIELEFLSGRQGLTPYPIVSLIKY